MSRRIAPKPSVNLTVEDRCIQNTTQGKLIITTYQERKCALILQNDRLVYVTVLSGRNSKIGAVYVGKIKNIVKNINACFVEIADGEICYMALQHVTSPYLLNRTYDGRILEGDELLVQITRDAQKTKQSSVSAQIVGMEEEQIQKALHRTCFSCIREAPGELESLLTGSYAAFFKEIITDDPVYYERLQNLSNQLQISVPLRLYEDKNLSLSAVYGLQAKMEMALERRIWLKSGAYLIIEPTEALTVIDVNTGKFDAKKDVDETFRKINLEAAEEIALQLRLRNLSGIILVDFINLKTKEDKVFLLNKLKELVKDDPIKTTIVDMTALGLVEITRKRVDKPLREQFLCKF